MYIDIYINFFLSMYSSLGHNYFPNIHIYIYIY